MKRSKIALISRTRDIIMGRTESSEGDNAWAQGRYKDGPRICLNAALRIAEHDLYEVGDGPGGDDDWYSRYLITDEGLDAQRTLVQAILEFHEARIDDDPERVRFETSAAWEFEPAMLHETIVTFNDSYADQENMNKVLDRAEKIGYERWIEDHQDLLPTNELSKLY